MKRTSGIEQNWLCISYLQVLCCTENLSIQLSPVQTGNVWQPNMSMLFRVAKWYQTQTQSSEVSK